MDEVHRRENQRPFFIDHLKSLGGFYAVGATMDDKGITQVYDWIGGIGSERVWVPVEIENMIAIVEVTELIKSSLVDPGKPIPFENDELKEAYFDVYQSKLHTVYEKYIKRMIQIAGFILAKKYSILQPIRIHYENQVALSSHQVIEVLSQNIIHPAGTVLRAYLRYFDPNKTRVYGVKDILKSFHNIDTNSLEIGIRQTQSMRIVSRIERTIYEQIPLNIFSMIDTHNIAHILILGRIERRYWCVSIRARFGNVHESKRKRALENLEDLIFAHVLSTHVMYYSK